MNQNERIEVIRAVYPGYSKPLDSMCKRPEYYGVKRTPEAQALISKKRPKRDVYNLHVCVPNGFVDMVEFRRQLIEMGYGNFSNWVLRCIRRQQEEYKKGRPPSETETQPPPQLYRIKGGMSSAGVQGHRQGHEMQRVPV